MGRHRCKNADRMDGIALTFGQRKIVLSGLRIVKHLLSAENRLPSTRLLA